MTIVQVAPVVPMRELSPTYLTAPESAGAPVTHRKKRVYFRVTYTHYPLYLIQFYYIYFM